jgi:hypothetical protein
LYWFTLISSRIFILACIIAGASFFCLITDLEVLE